MKKAVLLVCLLAGMALASTKSYRVTLYQPSVIGGTELMPGDYKVEVQNEKIIIQNGKQSTEAGVKVENADRKFSATAVRYSNGDGKYRVQEIRLGGTTMRLVLN